MAGTPTSVAGSRLVSNISSADIVKNVAPVILMLQDDRKSLMTYLSALGTRPTDNSQFDWFSDEIVPNRGTTGASAASAASSASAAMDLSGQSTAVVYVTIDDRIYFPENGEIMRVSAVPAAATNVPCLRNRLGTATGTISVGSLWIKIGDARAGNSRLHNLSTGALESVTVNNSSAYNYTQTFREPFGMSRREAKTKLYSGKDEATQKAKKLMEHCEKIEHAFWFNQRQDEGSERTSTGGVDSWMLSGNSEAIPTLTEEEFDDFVRRITRYGRTSRRVLFASRFVAMKISQWAYANQRVESGKKVKNGVHVTSILTGNGIDVDIVTADALEGLPGSTTLGTFDGYAYLLDMSEKKKVVFGGDDLKYTENLQPDDQDGMTHCYLSDVGYQPGDQRKDGRITGVTG